MITFIDILKDDPCIDRPAPIFIYDAQAFPFDSHFETIPMKLATWNVNSLNVRLPQVLDWLQAQSTDAPMDVLALQETKLTDDKFPRAEIEASGHHVAYFGQKTYNGVALISRHPLQDVVNNIPGFEDDMARVISATVQGVRVIGAYFPNGQAPDSDKFVYKMRWLEALHQYVSASLQTHPQLVLMGDYNITWDDRDVWDPVGLAGTIHCTDAERAHFKNLLDLGLVDAFRQFELPRVWLSAQPGLAHRPHFGLAISGGAAHRLHHRQGPAQKRAPQRPHAGGGGHRADPWLRRGRATGVSRPSRVLGFCG
jgi:exodeoxyribonuclease-3